MTENKRNPNPFIRMAQEAKEAREQKFNIPGLSDKTDIVGKSPGKMNSVPRANKITRKAGRGR
jgi:hypothetical protein